jgi:hypothetical protein
MVSCQLPNCPGATQRPQDLVQLLRTCPACSPTLPLTLPCDHQPVSPLSLLFPAAIPNLALGHHMNLRNQSFNVARSGPIMSVPQVPGAPDRMQCLPGVNAVETPILGPLSTSPLRAEAQPVRATGGPRA